MKKQVVMAFMLLSLCGAQVVAVADDVVAPPPPKPECQDIVYRKWNDLLFVDNGNEQFVAFQWYKNHVAIPGETKQYIYTQGVVMEGDGNIYHVVATKANGDQVISCEGRFEDFSSSAPLNPGKVIKKAVLYSYTGDRIGEWNAMPERPVVAPGCYIWVLTDDNGNIWSERILY